MQSPWQNIQGFSGASAVGAIVFVDLALIANAFADNLFPTINLFAQSATWAIVVAIPLLSLVYLIGVLSIGAGEGLLGCLHLTRQITHSEDVKMLLVSSEAVWGRYQQLRQDAELLAGSVVAFALLGVGSALSAWMVPGWRRFLTSVALAGVFLPAVSIALASRKYAAVGHITIGIR